MGDSAYQLFFVFQANVVRALLNAQIPVWMMQQDTFWRANLFANNPEKSPEIVDALFDRMGYDENGARASWLNGANYFVRPTEQSRRVFEQVAYYASHYFTQKMALLIYFCHTDEFNCKYLPYR